MTQVLPAIIATSYEDLSFKMSEVKGIAKLVQVDVCDGKFVPSKSWHTLEMKKIILKK